MESLRRKQLLRQQSKARALEVRKRQAVGRTGQVGRTTIDVGDEAVPLDEAVLGTVETAIRVDEADDAIYILDQDQAGGIDHFLDGAGVAIEDVLDVEELSDESVLNDVDRWEETAEAAEETHAADMGAIETAERVTDVQKVADDAMEQASLSTETALGNARYRQVDGAEIVPPLPEDGVRVGAELVRVNSGGKPYKVEVWNGAAWVHAQYLADEILIPGENGTIRLGDGTVSAPNVSAGAIDGLTVTGAIVRSAATGQRVQMDTSGIRTFNASNAVTASLSASSGGIRLVGALYTEVPGRTAALEDGRVYLADNTLGTAYLTTSGMFSTRSRLFISNEPESGFDIGITLSSPGDIFLDAPRIQFRGDTAGWVDLSSYLRTGFSGTLKGRIYGQTVEISGEISGIAIVSGPDPYSFLATVLPSQWRPTGHTRPGNASGNGLAGIMQARTTGSLWFVNRSGTNWGASTPIMFGITYLR